MPLAGSPARKSGNRKRPAGRPGIAGMDMQIRDKTHASIFIAGL